jgi:iron complex transport system ATP-binding protein
MQAFDTFHITNLVWGYPQKPLNTVPFSMQFAAPACVFLLGANGVGKSTFLRTLGGLQKPLSGKVEWGASTANSNINPKAAFVFPHRPQVEFMRIRDLIRSGFESLTFSFRSPAVEQEAFFQKVVEVMGLQLQLNQYLSEVSDGEFQKAMIARAWLQNTSLLLLDEPAAFLDYKTKNMLFALLQTIAIEEQKLIVVSTHDPELAFKYGQVFWVIKDNRCLSYTKEELGLGGLSSLLL